MDLLNPERQLVHQGRVFRKPDAFDFEWTDLLAVLFDNYCECDEVASAQVARWLRLRVRARKNEDWAGLWQLSALS